MARKRINAGPEGATIKIACPGCERPLDIANQYNRVVRCVHCERIYRLIRHGSWVEMRLVEQE
jgi:ribosomal protein S27E